MALAEINIRRSGVGIGRTGVATLLLGLAAVLALAKPAVPDFLVRVPDWAVLPYDVWLQALFDFVRDDLGLIHVTRAISAVLEWLLDVTANLLYGTGHALIGMKVKGQVEIRLDDGFISSMSMVGPVTVTSPAGSPVTLNGTGTYAATTTSEPL